MIDYSDVKHPRNARLHTKPIVPEGDFRTPAQRDKDRILYTSAFRRLAEVTQVASPTDAHVFHNRLTHSLQVGQVGRGLAQRLRGNEQECELVGGVDPDTVEAACFAHDLGHPPFGHTAEEALNKLVGAAAGGFEGNAQSFRIVTKLAFKSTKKPGLDLTAATLAAVLKYPWFRAENPHKPLKWGAYASESDEFDFARGLQSPGKFNRSPEAALMDWADDVTYSVHDVEDFFRAGKIPMHLLARASENRERQRFFDDVYRRRARDKNFPKRPILEEAFVDILGIFWRIYEPYAGTREHRSHLRYFTAQLIHRYVNGVALDTKKRSVAINAQYEKEVAILKELTWTYVIEAPALALQREGQRRIIKTLFETYYEASEMESRWSIFPQYYRDQLEKSSTANARKRIVADLIAGMTESQAIEEYRQVTGTLASPSSLQEVIR